MSACIHGGEEATAATARPLQRIKTTLHGKPHWVMLSDPNPADGNYIFLLTPHQVDAAHIHYEATSTAGSNVFNRFSVESEAISTDTADGTDIGPDGKTPQYMVANTATGPELIRPRYKPDLFCQLGTVSLFTTPSPITWIRHAVPEPDVDHTEWATPYKIALATEPKYQVSASHAVGIMPKRSPYLLLTEPDTAPGLTFETETLCTDCGFCWTTHLSHICRFCRGQAAETAYIATHGKAPEFPCDCCGTMTPYGGYCSQACEWDAEGCPRGGRDD